ncbi:MAG: hypothetical protein JWM02_2726 [Frankiales bacterium]|nr:hypothetical protein [Frankiales bacterium]
MDEGEIHGAIAKLVAEEHQLRADPGAAADQQARLRELEVSLDQCWDLLRQRQALKESGVDPDTARTRSVAEVEGYLQ